MTLKILGVYLLYNSVEFAKFASSLLVNFIFRSISFSFYGVGVKEYLKTLYNKNIKLEENTLL